MNLSKLKDGWLAGDAAACASLAAQAGSLAMIDLATIGLSACSAAVDCALPEIAEVVRVGSTRAEWDQAHKAFDRVRALTLEAERGRLDHKDPHYLLLFVAENSARVIYNASCPVDPFDDDSGEWLLRTMCELLNCLTEVRRAATLNVLNSCLPWTD